VPLATESLGDDTTKNNAALEGNTISLEANTTIATTPKTNKKNANGAKFCTLFGWRRSE
jgi:hypothetical protein